MRGDYGNEGATPSTSTRAEIKIAKYVWGYKIK